MDTHGHIIIRAHLGSQYDSGFPVIYNTYLHLMVSVLHKLCLLPVLIIRCRSVVSHPLCPGQADSRAEHMKPPYTDSVGALNAHGFQNLAARVMGRDDSGAHRVGGQGNVIRSLYGIVINRSAVSHRIHPGHACLLPAVHQKGPISKGPESPLSKGRIGPKSNAEYHHIRLITSLVRHHTFHPSFALQSHHLLPKSQLHPVLLQIVRHPVRKLPVIISGQACIRQVNQNHLPAIPLKCLSQLHPDISGAHHSHLLNRSILKLLNHIPGILIQLHKLHIIQLHPLNLRAQRNRPGGQNQFIILLHITLSVLSPGIHSLPVKINSVNLCLHMNDSALFLKSLLTGVEQPLRPGNLPPNPKRHTAPQKADIRVPVKGHHPISRKLVQNSIQNRRPPMIRPDNDNCFFHIQ